MNNTGLMSQLTNEERILVNSEVEKNGKSMVVAYLLAAFFGTLGIHRFYMGKNGSGLAMLLITVLTLGIGVIVTGIWNIVDLFLIPGWVKENHDALERSVAESIVSDPLRYQKEG